MIFLEILQGFKFYWNICIDCCTFCYKKVSSTETRDGAINSVQPTRNGCEDVCHSFRSGRNATQQQDISSPEVLLYAGASDGCFSAGCQMATLPHPPQVRSQFWFSQKKIVDSLTHFLCWQMFRFCSSKTGRIYLHTDIRIIVLRKSDVDTASAHIATEGSYEWKSFTRGPSSPRFSTRWPTFFFFLAIIIAINFHGRRANCRFPNCPENRVLGIIYCLFVFSKRQT